VVTTAGSESASAHCCCVFNIFDDQQLIRVQDLVGGGNGFAYLEGIDYVQPRRFYLGARLRF
jgi:hypothetical protein